MAYASVVTVNNLGAGRWLVQINESEAGAATEAVISGLPSRLKLLKQVTSLVSGTATTIDPILGTATNPSGVNVVASNETAAADVNNLASPAIVFYNGTSLHHRSVCDAGADNVVVSLYFFENWT